MGGSNKEPMETYADRKVGIEITKKKKKKWKILSNF
jgi:hypothetical protein